MKSIHAIAAAVLVFGGIGPLTAQTMPAHHTGSTSSHPAEMGGRGEVQKIDAAQRRITLKHEAGNAMPAMSMVYRVADAAVLSKVKVGDTVRFRTAANNATITELQALH